ncbi:MAG TPA: hypothetical protein VFV10_17580 [Gammaproteobacteria bacterium]|nr:hypothetical protein [Gammaproteobacteria bacterium]
MFFGLLQQDSIERDEQLLKLYWNRAEVKRELRNLRRERYELLDKLKEQESSIARAHEQLEGLERLLANPLAAANAMVYFQLRHLWKVAAARIEQFGAELDMQRRTRERRQLHEAELAKRKRRLDAIREKLDDLADKRRAVIEEAYKLEQRLQRSNFFVRVFKGPGLRRRLNALAKGRRVLEDRLEELRSLTEKIRGEELPEPEGLTLESRRLINTAIIALAQHLVVHFTEHDLASLAKTATQRPVGEMHFGDRAECDRMVERIRERLQDLKQQKLAEAVRRRAEALRPTLVYRNETDALPQAEALDTIPVILAGETGVPARRAADAPLRANVLTEDYWDLLTALR